jgi:two-component system response regulator AgrA
VRALKFNIIICEDNKKTISAVSRVVQDYFGDKDVTLNLHQIQSDFEKTVYFAKNKSDFENIYLLDINLSDRINGLNLVQRIRQHDFFGYIIFITSHTELGMKALSYKLKILDFIAKDDANFVRRLSSCFDTILKEILEKITSNKSAAPQLIVKFGSDYFSLCQNDIIYIETDSIGRKVIIHTETQTIACYMTLREIKESLTEDFHQCHRAFIVNTAKIKKIHTERNHPHVEMYSGDICSLSHKCAKELINIVVDSP